MTVTNFESSKQIVILCDFCFQEITDMTRIKCECQIDVCIRCFYSSGCAYYKNFSALEKYNIDKSKFAHFKEDSDIDFFNSLKKSDPKQTSENKEQGQIKSHLPTHRYYCIEPLNYTVIDSEWTALEELIFFEMLVSSGIGNWNEISTHMKTKTPEEVEKHFYLIFNIENNTTLEKSEIITTLSNPNNHIVSVYAPKREDLDFEEEYEQESNLKFLDQAESQEVKDFLLDSYKNLIILRKFKKLTIFEKKLTEIDFVKSQREKISKHSEHIYDLCAPLAQFISKNDLNKFFNGLVIENYLLNFKASQIKTSSDIFAVDILRKQKASEHEIQIVEKLNLTYSTYTKLKKYAILSHLQNDGIKSVKKYSSDPRCEILLEFFRKKRIFL